MSPAAPNQPVGILRAGGALRDPLGAASVCSGPSGVPGRLVGVPTAPRSRGDGTLLLTVFVYVGIAVDRGRAPGAPSVRRCSTSRPWRRCGRSAGRSGPRRASPTTGPSPSPTSGWPGSGLTIDLRFDWFSMILVLLVGGVGLCVFWYAASYFHDGPEVPRTAAVLLLFAGSMFGLVCSDNLFLLFMFWELTSITSFLLIGTNDENAGARSAALHALLVTGGGGLAMLGGFVLIGQAAGTYSLHAILTEPPSGTTVTVGLVLVLLGALTKSAQVPFHSWLPGAMAAPTPISAYLHSATMVKAGVYLIARFAPAFAIVGPWRWIVLGVRRRQHAPRRLPGAAPARPQAGARLRHHQPARPARGALRGRGARAGVRRVRPAHRPRRVQGRAVPHRRHHRPPDPHPRPAGPHRPRPAPPGRSPPAPRSPPPRWPACRRCSASSPRSSPSTACSATTCRPSGVLLVVVVVGLDVHRRLQRPVPLGRVRPGRHPARARAHARRPRGAAPLEGLRGRADGPGRRSGCCSASCPPSSARWSTTRGRPSATRATPPTSPSGTASPSRSGCRPWSIAGGVAAVPRPGPGRAVAGRRCRRVPSARGRLRAVDQGPALGLRQGRRCGPERLDAGVPHGPARHHGGRARRAAGGHRRALDPGPTWSTRRSSW